MARSISERDELLVQAYCDDELDPASMLEFERRLAADQSLQARRDQIMALRRGLQSLPAIEMPHRVQQRVVSAIDRAQPQPRSWSWRAIAASAVAGAIVASVVILGFNREHAGQNLAQQIVSSHIRGLLAPQPFDVASSDRHTVKPWFSRHVAESPQVVDLASQGFPLVGGRVDVIGRDAVATIVYRHAAHLISVMVLPKGKSVPAGPIAGYNLRSWTEGNLTYVAVSDIPDDDLAAFVRAFSAGAAQEGQARRP